MTIFLGSSPLRRMVDGVQLFTVAEKLMEVLSLKISGTDRVRIKIASPWVSDHAFTFSGRGTFSAIYPEARKEVYFSEIIKRISRRGEVQLICRPPHQLFSAEGIMLLSRLLKEQESLRREAIDEAISSLRGDILCFKGMIKMLHELKASNVKIRYIQDLHAKVLIIDDDLALLGSSNYTYSGMYKNIEINILFSEKDIIKNVEKIFDSMWESAETIEEYSKKDEFRRLLLCLRELQEDPAFNELYVMLESMHQTS